MCDADCHLKSQASSPVLGQHAETVQLVGNTGRQPLVGAAGVGRGFAGNAVEPGIAKPNHATPCSITGGAVVVIGAGKATRVAACA